MGTWGAGLYSSDYALDLRGTISALSRLPFDGDEILVKLRANEQAADDEQDEDHTIFWLVTAEQFTKRGIDCREAVDRALDIIATGKDIAMMTELGLPPASAKQRKKKLDELAVMLRGPVAKVARKTLKSPQPILMQPNTAWRYSTQEHGCRNPHFATAEEQEFIADGLGALLVLNAGRAFDWLAWYVVVPVRLRRTKQKPELKDVFQARFTTRLGYEFNKATQEYDMPTLIIGGAGTVSKTHIARMELECLGGVNVDAKFIPDYLDDLCISAAVSDRTIANQLRPGPGDRADGPFVRDWLCK